MRILAFSDSHQDIESCITVINRIIGIDMIVHAGDHASDAQKLARVFSNIPIRYVSGNCDFSGVGMDTSTRANLMSAVYTAQAAVNTTRTVVQAVAK